ncbi:MAG: NAD-dependent epimerase/dehydratase family protein [Eubacteriales bacterium]
MLGFFNMLEGGATTPRGHFLYASSSSVLRQSGNNPVFQWRDRVDKPVSLYAATKKEATSCLHIPIRISMASRQRGCGSCSLRPVRTAGHGVIFKFAKAILEDRPIDVYNGGNMLRDFTYIDDVTGCMENMLFSPPRRTKPARRTPCITSGTTAVKLTDFITAIEHAVGKRAQLHMMPMQAGDVEKTYADIEKTQRDFGFAPGMISTGGSSDSSSGIELITRKRHNTRDKSPE